MSVENFDNELIIESAGQAGGNGEPLHEGTERRPETFQEREETPLSDPAEIEAVVEALIFMSPEPIAAQSLSEVTGLEVGLIIETVNGLIDNYGNRGGGVVIREVAEGYAMYTVPEATPYISRLIKSNVNPRLTRAALETLAVVAYLQPVSRGVVSEIRGVHSDGVIKTLEERGFIKPVGKGMPPGYPTLYGTTRTFLERFGLNSIEEIPDLNTFAPDDQTVERIKRTLTWEAMEGSPIAERDETGENTEDNGEDGAGFQEESGKLD
ncbi:MAG: SMC-Scp complex subunit ScpB [Actinobacteria bacterium]|nr:SMC-Scp complex subunit ScpB [Actinomycetota bacterium]